MTDLDVWFREIHQDHFALSVRVKNYLWSGRSGYQTVDIIDTQTFGRVLLLDGVLNTSERDEFIYHEMIAHAPLFTHPEPRRVLVIGGGDGGTVRETLRHPTVEHVDMVEIDRLVVEKSREYLPTIACALDDPKLHIHFEDGIQWVKKCSVTYDVIVVDSTDPVGPALGLFSERFYTDCCRALAADGLLAAQTESPFFDQKEVQSINRNLRASFEQVCFYTASVPTYPGGYWSFALASKGPDPLVGPDPGRFALMGKDLRYYNPEVHRAAFALPNYVRQLLTP
jgi:spermidine synthase